MVRAGVRQWQWGWLVEELDSRDRKEVKLIGSEGVFGYVRILREMEKSRMMPRFLKCVHCIVKL